MHPENLTESLKKHPFTADLDEHMVQLIHSCASNVSFAEGDYLFKEGESATTFYLIRTGRIVLEVHAGERGPVRIQTVGPGEVLGWSWLISPFRWHFDAYAVDDVRAFALDGKCLRNKCEADHHLGYQMLKRLAQVLENRLQATRLQLLDVYGTGKGEEK